MAYSSLQHHYTVEQKANEKREEKQLGNNGLISHKFIKVKIGTNVWETNWRFDTNLWSEKVTHANGSFLLDKAIYINFQVFIMFLSNLMHYKTYALTTVTIRINIHSMCLAIIYNIT